MKILLLTCLMLIACEKVQEVTQAVTQTQKVPEWVPKGVTVQMDDDKVVMTADLARALTKEFETRQKDYFLRGIAGSADMGLHEYQDEIQGDAFAKTLVGDLNNRGFVTTMTAAKANWYIVRVTW